VGANFHCYRDEWCENLTGNPALKTLSNRVQANLEEAYGLYEDNDDDKESDGEDDEGEPEGQDDWNIWHVANLLDEALDEIVQKCPLRGF
jgi:hypothetical protein